jgi:predicted nucleotidyltransferase component of viral defense system
MIPLANRIKKEAHRNIASAQDLIIKSLYAVFNDAVLHGGTAIWRCYGGKRFSEDIDVYIPKDKEKIDALFLEFGKEGFAIEKKKISENSIYSNLRFNRVEVRFEAIFKEREGTIKDYENVDGTFVSVYTLKEDEFIEEKVNAYLGRRKIRDLYDVFFLIKYVQDKEKIKEKINRLIKEYLEPFDEKDLKVLVLEGLVPTSQKMLEYIKSEIR